MNVPPGIFLNTLTDLTLVDKELNEIWHRLAEAENFDKRVEIIRCWIQKKKWNTYKQEIILSAYLNNAIPTTSVADLAEKLCYSVRQLNRKSHEFFGLSTEALIHYKRYLSSLRLLHHQNRSLTDIAYQSGFYDQSHFIHDFRDFTGITPSEYRKQKSDMSAHLFS